MKSQQPRHDAVTAFQKFTEAAKRRRLWLFALLPVLVNLLGVYSQRNPLGSSLNVGFMVGVLVSLWLVRRCEYHAGKTEGIPNPETHKVQALIFGFVRAMEVIVLFWLPDELFRMPWKNDVLAFVVLTKAATYINFMYWVTRLERPLYD